MVNWPVDLGQAFLDNLTAKQVLLRENATLRSELLLAHAKLQRVGFLEQENSQLHVLLNSVEKLKTKFLAAQLQVLQPDRFKRQIVINKGKRDNLYVGQPVIDAYGLFGQVILVGQNISAVLLLTDVKSAVPVMIVRNGIQAIAIGIGRDDNLELVNTPETTDIKVGDFLVTSGIGQRFPAGYAVGVVNLVQRVAGERFVKILVTPSAHINRSSNILLIWTNFVGQLKNDPQ